MNFIQTYDRAVSEGDCDRLISIFENSPNKGEGYIMLDGKPTIDHSFKQSIELPDCRFSKSNVMSATIKVPLEKCIVEYVEKYSILRDGVSKWNIVDAYTFKKYETEKDGYKAWHCEHAYAKGYDGLEGASRRILAWMFYLNNAKSGTEFMQYPTVRARMGRCVIWPAGWTHVHRGVIPNKGLKYIITGWVSLV